MADKKQTTETTKDIEDKFWGQPHYEGEKFDAREFEHDFLQVYMHEPFLGGVSLGISKGPDPNCSTAYVGFNRETHELFMGYNPYFFRSLQAIEREGVIIHESVTSGETKNTSNEVERIALNQHTMVLVSKVRELMKMGSVQSTQDNNPTAA
jgi:hypothetical protein